MAPRSLSVNISAPEVLGYKPLSPYNDDANALSNNLICPRDAESDGLSPSSPTSIESFDILDSIAWRRGYTSYDTKDVRLRACDVLRKRWKKSRGNIIALLLFFMLLVAGCSIGGVIAFRHERGRTREACLAREGGDRCQVPTWAKCVAANGVGYCDGIM